MYHFVVLPWLWPCVCLSEDQQERKTQSETMNHGPSISTSDVLKWVKKAGGQRAGCGRGGRGVWGSGQELKSWLAPSLPHSLSSSIFYTHHSQVLRLNCTWYWKEMSGTIGSRNLTTLINTPVLPIFNMNATVSGLRTFEKCLSQSEITRTKISISQQQQGRCDVDQCVW